MKKKLTLTVEESVIEMAKAYAEAQQVSVSSIFENMMRVAAAPFRKKSKKKSSEFPEEIHPDLAKLQGVISLPPDFDERDAHGRYLTEKFLK